MSVKRFKFVSPGVFVNEIDNSQLPAESNRLGPVVIGRTERGPGMRPVTVASQAEFVEMFGLPIAGGQPGDVWRDGNYQSPTYGPYAAMAYLRNNGPVTVVRLLGHQHENAGPTGKAGWDVATDAYALWLWDSCSVAAGNPVGHENGEGLTGTLAAVFYCDSGAIALKGPRYTGVPGPTPGDITATGVAITSVGAGKEFRAVVYNDATNTSMETTFNFNRNSDMFIRKVFNTNPALLSDGNEIHSDNAKTYFLGQTYEDHIGDHLVSSSAGDVIGFITPWSMTDDSKDGKSNRGPAAVGSSGWIISQQLSSDSASFAPTSETPEISGSVNRLFKLNALDCGEWESVNLKVSIEDIRYSRSPVENPYGSFTVTVRRRSDNDAAVKVVERFANCNLNPMSPDYVKRKIGDQTLEWDEAERRYKHVGDYPNNSKFVVVEVNGDMDNAVLDPSLLPFGFQGPPKLNDIIIDSADPQEAAVVASSGAKPIMFQRTTLVRAGLNDVGLYVGSSNLKLVHPKIRCRTSSDQGGLANRKKAYWGVDTMQSGSAKATDAGWSDLVYPLPDLIGAGVYTNNVDWAMSLDDVRLDAGVATWAEDNRVNGDSWSASGSDGSTNSWKSVLDEGIDRFTMPLWGGFDGLDIVALDPFAPDRHIIGDATDKTNYEYYSVRKAIDICADSEVVECNAMVVPGITTTGINQHLVNVVENRADALAILDIAGGYSPRAHRKGTETSFSGYGGTVDATLIEVRDLGINSSYACTYYPWVQIRDTSSNAVVWVPPSVVALGTMGSSEAKSEVWFAPAGFTRGGLTEGSAGMPVVGVRDRLTSKQRDELYQQNVNPIATFPAEGIVIFGQKTMQVTASALDRINVRRLMIFVKKEISRMAATILFDQNVRRTWNRFLGRVEPFLRSVQARMGLQDFKVILDETTTTPELMDRNIMYAKILLKPARAIEFIAIDFVITDSGASFED